LSRKILDDMRDVMRRRHYSIRTERSYCAWVKRFVLHFNMKSRDDLTEGEKKIETYLTFLARDRNVAPSTQNQALNSLVFLYKQVLKQPLNEKINAERAATKIKIPVVLTRDETKRIIGVMTGIHQLKRGHSESAGINRHRVGDERALHERSSCSIMAPSHARAAVRVHAKR